MGEPQISLLEESYCSGVALVCAGSNEQEMKYGENESCVSHLYIRVHTWYMATAWPGPARDMWAPQAGQ